MPYRTSSLEVKRIDERSGDGVGRAERLSCEILQRGGGGDGEQKEEKEPKEGGARGEGGIKTSSLSSFPYPSPDGEGREADGREAGERRKARGRAEEAKGKGEERGRRSRKQRKGEKEGKLEDREKEEGRIGGERKGRGGMPLFPWLVTLCSSTRQMEVIPNYA